MDGHRVKSVPSDPRHGIFDHTLVMLVASARADTSEQVLSMQSHLASIGPKKGTAVAHAYA